MPRILEVKTTASFGGTVQIEDYGKVKSDFFLSDGETWNVEDLTTDEEINAFVEERRKVLLGRIEAQAQVEYQWRFDWRDGKGE